MPKPCCHLAVPTAIAQTEEYHTWVGKPELPETVIDLGLRAQPNRELAASLDLDLFLLSPQFSALEPTLSQIAPVTTLPIYRPDSDLWQNLVAATRRLAGIAGVPARADRVIDDHRKRIQKVRNNLPATLPPMLVIQFIDNRHVRVYGKGSLYDMVMDRLGLENAWQGGTNLWGYTTVGIEDLTNSAYLIVVDPMPMGVAGHLAENRLWQKLPAVRDDRVLQLPAIWSFGGLPSAARFAEGLGTALQEFRSGSVTTDL